MTGTKNSGRRTVPQEDKIRFWEARAAGISIKEACKIAGIHYNTGQKWDAKRRQLQTDNELAKFDVKKALVQSGRERAELRQSLDEAADLPPVIPYERLSERAKRGWDDFDYFRRVYLGRVPSPWQVDAAYKIVQHLESEEKEFLVLNCPPGAGKSTLFHDVAVWCIVRNRAIRVLIGSISQTLAKQYSRRIRETLERPTRLIADPEMVKKGLTQDAEGCLAQDYGRFKPLASGSLWRAEEFVVEQPIPGGLDNKEPTVSAYGIDSEFIGHRADLCLFDDVASPENAKESVARDRLLERWDSMAEARCDPGGLVNVIGQRLGPGDLYAHCMAKVIYEDDEEDDGEDITVEEHLKDPVKKQKYHQLIYKAYYDELDTGPKSRKKDAAPWPEGPLLDPVRLPWKDLSYIRYNQPQKFRVVYQQEDVDLDYQLVDRAMITGGIAHDGIHYEGCIDRERQPGHLPRGLQPPWISIISVDPSPSQFWGVIWTVVQPDLGLYHVVDIERVKLTAEELLGYDMATGTYTGILPEWIARSEDMWYPVSHVVVEVNAAQRFLLAHDFVRRWQALTGVTIVPHTTSRNKLDENLGLEALIPPVVRSGSLRLPSMSGNWKTLALVDELVTWTRDKKRGTDLAMALWFMLLHAPKLTTPKLPPRMWRPSFMLDG
jgi:transposase-like protein